MYIKWTKQAEKQKKIQYTDRDNGKKAVDMMDDLG